MRILMLILLAAMLPVLAGCNTTEGLGKDVERAGENIQDTVDRNR